MTRLNAQRVSFSLALAGAVLYLICALLFAVAPAPMIRLTQDLFHGINIASLGRVTMSWGSLARGTIAVMIWSGVTGWIFAFVYNKLAGDKP